MINAKDLRIGNLILFNPKKGIERICLVMEIKEKEIIVKDNGLNLSLFELEFQPIPLTPDMLQKCGFEKWFVEDYETNDVYEKSIDDDLSIEITSLKNGDFILCVRVDEYRLSKPFRFIHQLQNLYYALTQTELNIQL